MVGEKGKGKEGMDKMKWKGWGERVKSTGWNWKR
jgi:hypothetical protein